MFTGALVGCSDAPSKGNEDNHGEVPGAAPAPAASGDAPSAPTTTTAEVRPLGGFRGTLELKTPAGDLLRLPVEALGRMVPDDDATPGDVAGAEHWDLFFRDPSRVLSTTGVLGLVSGNADWLADVTADHTLRAEVVSLRNGVLGSPGWSVARDAETGRLTGNAFLRIPTAGADLSPLAYSFSLEPAADVVACDAAASCGGAGVCDGTTGFCAPSTFRAGSFRLDYELTASHRRTRAWLTGPALPDPLVDGAGAPSLMGIWCAGDAVGFGGAWTFPSLPAGAELVMSRSGELRCVDPSGQARTRGPVPFVSRADLVATGLMAQPGSNPALLTACLNELDRSPSAAFENRRHGGDDFTVFRDGFLDYQADCVSLGHVAAVLTAAQRAAINDGAIAQGQVSSRRVIGRVLQQWTELHAFVLREGLEQARQSRSSMATLLDRAADGWSLVAEVLAYDFGPALLDAQQPDYRAGLTFGLCDARAACGDPALRCQGVEEACPGGGVCGQPRCVLKQDDAQAASDPAGGLAPALLDGLAAHMDVVAADLTEAATRDSSARAGAIERFGRAMREALVIETISAMVRQRAAACAAGATSCSLPAWTARWDAAHGSFTAARAGALAAAASLPR